MAKREFDEVNVNQILFHMQLLEDNIVTMPGDFIDVFYWHLRNSLLCGVTLAFLRETGTGENSVAVLHRSQCRRAMTAALCLVLAVLWFAVPGDFMDGIFVWVRALFLAALAITALCAQGWFNGLFLRLQSLLRWVSGGWRLAAVWAGVLAYALCYINFFTFFQEQAATSDFYTEGAYVDPRTVNVSGSGSKNLLIVYCESIEETFGRRELMGEDLLEPLRPYIEEPDLRIEQMPGADFTIGGIVSSQCGIPLKSVSILSGNLTGWALDRFLPGAVCLGDYLKADGYHNVYYNGSSGVFSGLNKFFLSHGYDEFMGKEEWLDKGFVEADRLNTWAVYDKDIVDLSIARLDQLMAEGRKFSFAISTMDTHEPGFLSEDCAQKGITRDWPGYVKCSLSQVGRLLEHIRSKGWEKDFVILVMGDHQARMTKLGTADLKDADARFVLCSLEGGHLRPMRSTITHFDLFPSILAALGFTVEGDRLGFGYNVFSQEVSPPAGYRDELKKRVLAQSRLYESLWLPEYAAEHAAQDAEKTLAKP
ncbi:sulfatase-like hydrolase/transferase [Mailhella sp.]|uniref:sulfatase-like hydrolase/transferase n=1 Tax=Mailhella sp. TaxID=1981029 RepID=UPI0040627CFF